MYNSVDYIRIGKRITEFRAAANMTQEALAERAELSVPHMSNIEKAKTKLSLPTLVAIANVLNCSADDLLVGNINKDTEKFNAEFASILDKHDKEECCLIMHIVKLLDKDLQDLRD